MPSQSDRYEEDSGLTVKPAPTKPFIAVFRCKFTGDRHEFTRKEKRRQGC